MSLAFSHFLPSTAQCHTSPAQKSSVLHWLVHRDNTIPIQGAGRRAGAYGQQGPRSLSKWSGRGLGQALGIWVGSWRFQPVRREHGEPRVKGNTTNKEMSEATQDTGVRGTGGHGAGTDQVGPCI